MDRVLRFKGLRVTCILKGWDAGASEEPILKVDVLEDGEMGEREAGRLGQSVSKTPGVPGIRG